jgi:hypothetical protein
LEQQLAFEDTCERYLLGELSEAEQAQLEEAYFADDALFERFLAVKDELLDAYARGELTEEKRARFAQHFRATEPRRQQIDEAQDLIRATTAAARQPAIANGEKTRTITRNVDASWRESVANMFRLRPLAWQSALIVMLLLALGGVWLIVRYRQRQQAELASSEKSKPQPLQATSPPVVAGDNAPSPFPTDSTANREPPPGTNATPRPTPGTPGTPEPQFSAAQIASLTLLPLVTRDITDENTLILHPATRIVRLRLVFRKNNYRSYSASLTTLDDQQVWQNHALKADSSKSVTLQIAPALLQQHDYLLTLSARTAGDQLETVGEYYFHVVRQ